MTDKRKAFEAWATDYFGANVSYPEACFDAWQAALRAQPDHSEQHLEMVAAARAVVERWETLLWKDAPATAGFINRLRDALPPAIGETME